MARAAGPKKTFSVGNRTPPGGQNLWMTLPREGGGLGEGGLARLGQQG